MNVLVVDDSKLARLSMIKGLNGTFDMEQIFQAENGQEAVDLAKKHNPAIVFLDLTMPVMDGYTALPLLLDINPNINVIIVTADIQEQAREKVMSLGAKMHIKKPITPEKLQDVLQTLRK